MNPYFIRIAGYIIAIIISIFFDAFGGRRYSRYRRFYGERTGDENSLADSIRANLRRRKVVKKNKNFVTQKKKSIILKNSNVMLVLETKKKTLVCMNVKNIKQTVSVEWINQPNSAWENLNDNTFEQTFDSICLSFNENTSYEGILKVLRSKFTNIKETNGQTQNSFENTNNNVNAGNTQLININEASAQQLSKMPGINIVTAKKIVKRINLKGDYETLDQMFNEMKIKGVFTSQLNNYLCAKPVVKEQKQENNNNRVIDVEQKQENIEDKIMDNVQKQTDNNDRIIDF